MSSATIDEVRLLLTRVRRDAGAQAASIEFSIGPDDQAGLRVTLSVLMADGADRAVYGSTSPETDAERKAGPLAYTRRVTLQMRALEDALKGGGR